MNEPTNSITLSLTPCRYGWAEPGGTFIGYQSSVGPLFQLDQVEAFAKYMNPLEFEHRAGPEAFQMIVMRGERYDQPWVVHYEKNPSAHKRRATHDVGPDDADYLEVHSKPLDQPVPGYYDIFRAPMFLHELEESVGLGPAPGGEDEDGDEPEPSFRDRLLAGVQETGEYGNGDSVMYNWVEGPGADFSTKHMGEIGGYEWHFELLGAMFNHDLYCHSDSSDPDLSDSLKPIVSYIKQAVLGDQEGDAPLNFDPQHYEEFLCEVAKMLLLARAARVHMPKGSPLRHDLDQEIHWNGAREFGDKEAACILSVLGGPDQVPRWSVKKP
jgi:hypothetical protein